MANAYLVLADGTVYEGEALGASGEALGEVVFTTGMTGYQETLTDPSYYGQIVCQTFPLIGNYGLNEQDSEADRSVVRGYVVHEACASPSNFRAQQTLNAFLKAQNVVAIQGVDTRGLTRRLRSAGVMNGAIVSELPPAGAPRAALMERVRAYAVREAVKAVSCHSIVRFAPEGARRFCVAVYDYGCKRNLVRELQKRGCEVCLVPYNTPSKTLRTLEVDGILLSNGPGDPAENKEAIAVLRDLLCLKKPMFGICLGHQLLALAMGAKTYKLPYGHRGANQPVTDLARRRTFITTQNHGYAVDAASVPPEAGCVSYVNANDGSAEGVNYPAANAFTVQFHPEACAGPRDTEGLFDVFLEKLRAAKEAQGHAGAQ